MRYYRLTLPQCKKLTSYDQAKMIEAIFKSEEGDEQPTKHFSTEAEYQQWLTTAFKST